MIVKINNFSGGIADDYTRGDERQCSMCKQFDIFTYPFRLQPLRGMTNANEPTNSLLGNIILGANGTMYGIGALSGTPTQGQIFRRTGYGASEFQSEFTTQQVATLSDAVVYDFLVHFPEMAATRKVFWADNGNLLASDPDNGGSV